MRLLADWLDVKYINDPTPQVQVDLRRWIGNINQALTLLKQQPTAGEFTKNIREDFSDLPEGMMDYTIASLLEACDIIDTAEAIKKDLLEACEELIENEPFGVTPYFDEALRKVEAAIAKTSPNSIKRDGTPPP